MKELNNDADNVSGDESTKSPTLSESGKANNGKMSPEIDKNRLEEAEAPAATQQNGVNKKEPEEDKESQAPKEEEAATQPSTDLDSIVNLNDFGILKVLGKGAYGKVFQVIKTRGVGEDEIYAMKVMNKARICGSRTDVRHTRTERKVLATVEHEFVVKLKFAFETTQKLYLVQEFCCGGELFRRMEQERFMREQDALFYLREILLALEYLHSLNIIYRDLKTENVMLDREGHVKLIDFGLSKTDVTDVDLTSTFCGTVEYMAPEVVSGSAYGKPADWWSFGVFTYDLLTGKSPFHSGNGKQATKDKILRGKFSTPRIMTPDAVDFCRKVMRRPIPRRLGSRRGAGEIKEHPFFAETDWNKVIERQYEPPFFPEMRNRVDVQNFDESFTSRPVNDSTSGNDDQERLHFGDFDFVADEFLLDSSDDDDGGEDSGDAKGDSPLTSSGVSSGASSSSVRNSLSTDSKASSDTDDAASKDSKEEDDLRICLHGHGS